MFGRKNKAQADQSEVRRQVQRGDVSPAFSYYTSRTATPQRSLERPTATNEQSSTPGKGKKTSRSSLLSVPAWFLLVIVVICTGKILLLSTDPKITIVGTTSAALSYLRPNSVYEAAAQKLLSNNVANRSKLTIDTVGVSQELKQEFPELQDVAISIPLVNSRPIVYIQPAEPSLIVQTTRGNFALNRSGLVLAALDKLPSGVAVAVDQSGLTPQPGKQLLPSSTVTFVETVLYQLNVAHMNISTFILPANSPYELDARIEGKPYVVRFNLEADALTQSGAAIAAIQQLGSVTPSGYIDVRVPGRVYYK